MKSSQSPYLSVAEDIDWLEKEWWSPTGSGLPEEHLRRGSTTLRLLLVDQLAIRAWQHHGFRGQPTVHGPDLLGLAAHKKMPIPHIFALIAGGGRINGLDTAMVGMYRADNPQTGAKALDDVGFAVVVTSTARKAGIVLNRGEVSTTPSDLDALVETRWTVNDYVNAPGAVFDGLSFSRREIIKYFANFAGGAHLDKSTQSMRSQRARYEQIAQLDGRIRTYVKDGLHFELQSYGQAIGKSDDFKKLAASIRRNHVKDDNG